MELLSRGDATSCGFVDHSNLFMTYAWYGHLKSVKDKPLWIAILVSWLVAFFEYCFQVPANRLGSEYYSLAQLKIMQEVITMIVFAGFAVWYMGVPLDQKLSVCRNLPGWRGLFYFRDGVTPS